ncbi:hypothetical protein MLDJOKPK_00284 [Salmonella phage SPAsTU]|nr:hypothetical protein STsAS_134 [Salmonella phage STsAS]AXF51135.1 hypothetical protein MLDJOKPK_00284 [Salmonella phage SPAsTU]
MKHLLFVFAFISLLTGCAMAPDSKGQFSTVPVTNHDMVIYTCTGANETFSDFRPELSNLQLLPRAVTVIDVGANWVATWKGNKLESPQLYKDLLGKVDGNIDPITGQRFYRLNAVLSGSPTFSYSTVNPTTGSGKGMTFFRCTIGSIDEPATPMLITPSPDQSADKVDAK